MEKVKFGLSNVHYATVTETLTNGEYTYEFGNPVHIPGAVSLTLSVSGDREVFRADNIDYYVSSSNSGYEGELEMAEFPDEFLGYALGMSEANGVLIESANDTAHPFALLYQVEGDTKARRHVLYNCTATRPEINAQTTDTTITPQTDTLPFNAMPMKDSNKRIKCAVSEDATQYDNFFTAVFNGTIIQS